MTLYTLLYNNYYNRIIKKFETISEYENFVIETFEGINFIPNDGVQTTQILNISSDQPDYLIACDENNQIVSRWFVIESVRLREGQYRLSLLRDVIADWYEETLNAPCFIEKATLPVSSPLIYNNEDMTFNQILQNRTLIQDPTACPWIVGYVPKNWPGDTKTYRASSTLQALSNTADFEVDSIATWLADYGLDVTSANALKSTEFAPPPHASSVYEVEVNAPALQKTFYARANPQGTVLMPRDEGRLVSNNGFITEAGAVDTVYRAINKFMSPWESNPDTVAELNDYFGRAYWNGSGNERFEAVMALQNQTLYNIDTETLYRIEVKEADTWITGDSIQYPDSPIGQMFTSLLLNSPSETYIRNFTPSNKSYYIRYKEHPIYIELVPMSVSTRVTFQPVGETSDASRYHCRDSVNDIFCIPFGDLTVYKNGQIVIDHIDPEASIRTAIKIGQDSGLTSMAGGFDLQLFPFCPVPYVYKNKAVPKGSIDIGDSLVNYIVAEEGSTNYNTSLVLWATSSELEFNQKVNYPAKTTAIEKKVQNECDFLRFCSPNYNGLFEFNVAKNNGLDTLEINCSLKPYNPFIQVKPKFKNLYGTNYDKDCKGLICGGDFSLPQLTSAWAQYELNNKNYQQIFDRGIQNQELKNNYQRVNQAVGMISSSISGAAGGAIAGAKTGPHGAVIGAVTGGLASTAGGILDFAMSEGLRKEAIDYSKDLFGYQLGNIRAIPSSISKTSAFVYNNVIFPFIEEYSCTDVEKQALRDKIKYNGMTVGVIGKLIDYQQPEHTYMKGQLIRLEGIADDYHIVNTIANEISKGVFI